jgi:hypothetical protein
LVDTILSYVGWIASTRIVALIHCTTHAGQGPGQPTTC